MSQTWSVQINGKPPASFDPDVFGTNSGQPLKAEIGDLVSWNNRSKEDHQIAVTNPQGTVVFTTEVIKYSLSSFPGYVIQQADASAGTVYYYCTLHLKDKKPTERGMITLPQAVQP
jgi:plastocyanin